jgi:hypothetical protein
MRLADAYGFFLCEWNQAKAVDRIPHSWRRELNREIGSFASPALALLKLAD